MEFKRRKQAATPHRRREAPHATAAHVKHEAAIILPEPTKVDQIRRILFDPKVIVVISVIFVASIAVFLTHQDKSDASGDPASDVTKPKFQTVLPDGKSIDKLGGWKRVNRPGTDPVFSFNDEIDGKVISVSEQTLPASFASDTDARIADLAKAYNATNKVKAGALTAYIGTSAKGPQSVILTKKDLLILIKSTEKIDEDSWVDYIKSLNNYDSGPKF